MDGFTIHGKFIETTDQRAWHDVTKIGAFSLEKTSANTYNIEATCDGRAEIFGSFKTADEARHATALMLISVSGKSSVSGGKQDRQEQGFLASLTPRK